MIFIWKFRKQTLRLSKIRSDLLSIYVNRLKSLQRRFHRTTLGNGNSETNRLQLHQEPEYEKFSELRILLTAEGVGEAVPNASLFSYEPASLCTGRKAERSPKHAHQQVAYGDVDQQQVNGGPQHLVAAEQNQHQQVVEESERTDEPEAHGNDQVPGRAEGGPERTAPRVPFPGSGAQGAVELRAAAQAGVGHEHGSPCHCGGTPGGHGG